jgi:hypothetical protein
MHHFAVAGTDFQPADPGVAIEHFLEEDVLPEVLAVSGDALLVRQTQQDIGLAHMPAGCEGRRRRSILRIAGGRAQFRPLADDVDLRVSQPPVVREMSQRGVHRPGWHFAQQDCFLDGGRPGPHLFIREERHGRNLARPVALRAVRMQDRRDVFIKSWSGRPARRHAYRAR